MNCAYVLRSPEFAGIFGSRPPVPTCSARSELDYWRAKLCEAERELALVARLKADGLKEMG